jgi:serine/threonine protein kinase
MLSGHPPWHEYEGVAAIFKIATQDPPLYQIPKTASDVARDFLKLCLRRDKDQRPASNELLSHQFVNEFSQ